MRHPFHQHGIDGAHPAYTQTTSHTTEYINSQSNKMSTTHNSPTHNTHSHQMKCSTRTQPPYSHSKNNKSAKKVHQSNDGTKRPTACAACIILVIYVHHVYVGLRSDTCFRVYRVYGGRILCTRFG